jgi:hypothetical protein
MHAEVFTVATAGEVGDGLLSMANGGWECCEVSEFPAEVDLVLVGVIVYSPEDCGRNHIVSVSVRGSDGRTGALGTMLVAPSTAAAVVKTPFRFPMSLSLAGPVVLSLTATVQDGPTFGPAQFEVRRPGTVQPPDWPPPRPDRIRYARSGDRDAGGSAPGSELRDELGRPDAGSPPRPLPAAELDDGFDWLA